MNLINARHALLKAILHVITETGIQLNANNMTTLASSPAGVLMMMPSAFQFTNTQFYNFGVHINNVTATSIPMIFNGNSPEEILERTKRYAYENNGIVIHQVDMPQFEDQVIKRYEEITGEQFTIAFQHIGAVPAGQKVVTLLQEAVADEFAVLTMYITSQMGTPYMCTQAVGKIGPAMFQQNRFYESLSGIGFKILGEINSAFTIELQFTEPIMRTAKRDRAFHFTGAAWSFLNRGLAG